MRCPDSKAHIDAAAAAGGLTAADLYTQATGAGTLVLALSMKGLSWLVMTYAATPPPEDVLVLQANLLAVLAAKGTAWAQV
jgi:hypothetical protein